MSPGRLLIVRAANPFFGGDKTTGLLTLGSDEYKEVLSEMAQAMGVSRSSASREAVQASAEQLRSLREKRWDIVEILALPACRSQVESSYSQPSRKFLI